VLEDWSNDQVGTFPAQPIELVAPLPKRLEGIEPPSYFWLDGERMLGAKMDFEASGFVDLRDCPVCGARSFDVGKTYDRQYEAVCPETFVPGTWNGANLFTTDLSRAAFFCTEKVVDCAARHRHTNFRFIPVEEGSSCASAGLKYMK